MSKRVGRQLLLLKVDAANHCKICGGDKLYLVSSFEKDINIIEKQKYITGTEVCSACRDGMHTMLTLSNKIKLKKTPEYLAMIGIVDSFFVAKKNLLKISTLNSGDIYLRGFYNAISNAFVAKKNLMTIAILTIKKC